MRWLVTVRVGYDPDRLVEALADVNAHLSPEEPIPLGESELTIVAEGPSDLPPRRLVEANDDVIRVNPYSEPEPY